METFRVIEGYLKIEFMNDEGEFVTEQVPFVRYNIVVENINDTQTIKTLLNNLGITSHKLEKIKSDEVMYLVHELN